MTVSPRLNAMAVRLVFAPGWLRCMVLLAFGMVLTGLCWWLVLQELHQSLPEKSPALAEETRLVERRAALQKAQGELALVKAQREQLTLLENELPASADAQSAWATVHQASQRHGLRMAHFKPGPVGSQTPYPQQRASLRLSGSFDALLAFARTLAEAGSPVGIESYVLSSQKASPSALGVGDRGGSLTLEATLLSLLQPAPAATPAAVTAAMTAPATEVATGLARAVASAPPFASALSQPSGAFGDPSGDPFESGRLAASPASGAGAANALHSQPLSAMRVVGSVGAADPTSVSTAPTAVVLVGGTLYAVRVGDALGNAGGRVAEIRADGLTVREPGSPVTAQAVRAATLLIAKD